MFRKFFIVIFVCSFYIGAYGVQQSPQIVTSEVFYDTIHGGGSVETIDANVEVYRDEEIPVWPLEGSDADVDLVCEDGKCTDLSINNQNGWSGGPDLLHVDQVPAGFSNDCDINAEMPLLHRELLEDDGGVVLSVSRSFHNDCNRNGDPYLIFAQKAGFMDSAVGVDDENINTEEELIDVDDFSPVKDDVHSWVVARGQTLREVLQTWCDKEGWDLVWTTSREYPIEASAVFKGRFVDVASALVRNFGRATPIPYAKFYNGNKVLVISTTED